MKRIHYSSYEAPAFEQFIINALQEEANEVAVETTKQKIGDFEPDLVILKPLPILQTKRKAIVEIKFGNNPFIAEEAIKKLNRFSFDYDIVIIYCGEDFIVNQESAIVWGRHFVKRIAKKYDYLWWAYANSVDTEATIKIDYQRKRAILNTVTLGFNDFETTIDFENVNKISLANQTNFKMLKAKEKNTALILGNGVSIHFGSAGWDKLCDNIYDALNPFYLDNPQIVKKCIGGTNYSMSSIAKNEFTDEHFTAIIRNSIYGKYDEKIMHTDNTLLRSISKLKKKFKDIPIATYNYDTFLENDFQKLSGSKLKSISSAIGLSKSVEPYIIHVHGVLKENSKLGGSRLVLTDEDYYKTYHDNPWNVKVQKKLLKERTCLFVGSSMSDIFQLGLIHDVRKNMHNKNSKDASYYWKCYALLSSDGMSIKDLLMVHKYFLLKGIFIIFAQNFKEMPLLIDSLF